MKIKPRGWQNEAIEKYKLDIEKKCFMLDATPGSGKTFFAGFCVENFFEVNKLPFVVVVVPTTVLKETFQESFHSLGIELKTRINGDNGIPVDYDGVAITYQQLPNLIDAFRVWNKNGHSLMFVFDEIHHASEQNVWGSSTDQCGEFATKILSMTGTPFRSDGQKITFLKYDDSGVVISDYSYTYKRAVADNYCRVVEFMHDDGIAEYGKICDGEEIIIRKKISDATNEDEHKIASAVFSEGSDWLKTVLIKGDAKLDEYRESYPNAGGIIVCRPGSDDKDVRYLHAVAREVKKIIGTKPIVISYDDEKADEKIQKFRGSDDRWIVAVRKISEGVDIKRLRVMVMLSMTKTELFFRQLVGRVVRVEDQFSNTQENATVFMAKFPKLVDWGRKIREEAEQGLKEKNEEKDNIGNGAEKRKSPFYAKGCTHEDGGCTSMYGEYYTADEVLNAEVLKRNDPILTSFSIASIAHLMKKIKSQNFTHKYEETESLEKTKTKLRNECNKLIKHYAYLLAPDKTDIKYGKYISIINQMLGIKSMDDLENNHPIDKMHDVIATLKMRIKEHEAK